MLLKQALIISILVISVRCTGQKKTVPAFEKDAPVVAFPGAEGFGKFTTGGRGGKVLFVENLDDDGPGSFRKAVQVNGPKIIVFTVSGTIHLKSKLNIKGNATIAGQTAPGDGICLADQPVVLSGNNIIIRYLRFRMGDRFQNQGKVDGAGADDALGASGKKNIIIDHCSISWSTDELFSVYRGDSTTLQWNLIAEPLNYSYHFEEGDADFEQHGYGGIWGGEHLSAHHNLFAHCNSRTPRFNGVRLEAEKELVDFRNNVIYNWGHNNVYGGEGGKYNIVNNYYRYGPATKKNVRSRIVNPNKEVSKQIPFGTYYVNGNFVEGAPDVTNNNTLGVTMGNNGTDTDKKKALVTNEFPVVALGLEPATTAYINVLANCGAVLPKRDSLDERIIKNVKNRTGNFTDVQGGFPHGTPYEKTVTAWPSLQQGIVPVDSDKDGIPDKWEKAHRLNPNDHTDAVLFTLDKIYSNIEVYINSLIQ